MQVRKGERLGFEEELEGCVRKKQSGRGGRAIRRDEGRGTKEKQQYGVPQT